MFYNKKNKIVFIICLLIMITIGYYGCSYAATIDRVIDGDTFEIKQPKPPTDLLQTKHRLIGIDTPETLKQFAKCQKEIELGNKAKIFTTEFLKDEVQITYIAIDKYGRYLVDIDKNGLNLADELVRNGLAVYYEGGTKIKDWCK